MKRTGIFFHYQEGERLSDFPQTLGSLLERPDVFLYDAFYPSKPKASYDLEPVPQDLLQQVHSLEMIRSVKHTPYYETAIFSAGGTVQAAERIWEGEIDNAFVFTGTGDHHAGRNFFIPRILRRLTGDQEEKLLFTGRGKLGKNNLL